jgi:hypothetical protein
MNPEESPFNSTASLKANVKYSSAGLKEKRLHALMNTRCKEQ